MKHVIAYDVSMGKSYVVVYNALKTCIIEKEIQHIRTNFEEQTEQMLTSSQAATSKMNAAWRHRHRISTGNSRRCLSIDWLVHDKIGPLSSVGATVSASLPRAG